MTITLNAACCDCDDAPASPCDPCGAFAIVPHSGSPGFGSSADTVSLEFNETDGTQGKYLSGLPWFDTTPSLRFRGAVSPVMATLSGSDWESPGDSGITFSIALGSGSADAADFELEAVFDGFVILKFKEGSWPMHRGASSLDPTCPSGGSGASANEDNVFEVTVSATNGVDVDTQAFLITLTDSSNEPPVITHVEPGSDSGTKAWLSGGGATVFGGSTDTIRRFYVATPENQTDVTKVFATDPDPWPPAPRYDHWEWDRLGSEPATTCLNPLRYRLAPVSNIPYDGAGDENLFDIDADTGALSFKSPPDFENPQGGPDNDSNTYEVVVVVDDGAYWTQDHNHSAALITIGVTNVNETVVITSDGGGPTANIYARHGVSLVTTVVATDPENAGITYSISDVAVPADFVNFNIDADTGVVNFNTPPDVTAPTDVGEFGGDNEYRIIVKASDGINYAAQGLIITVISGPEIISDGGGDTASQPVLENTTTVTTVQATDPDDPDGDGLAYTITGGADQAKFDLDVSTGALTFKSAPDHEAPTDSDADNVYVVEVTVTDDGPLTLTDKQILDVYVSDAPENSPIIQVPEGAITGSTDLFAIIYTYENTTEVATIVATDADGDTITYSIPDPSSAGITDSDKFEVGASTGVLSFKTAPDHENDLSESGAAFANYYFTEVMASDSTGNTDLITIWVRVQNVEEPPVITSDDGGDDASVDVDENETDVTDVNATSVEGDSITFSIIDGDDKDLFSINSGTGVLTFNAAPDFESPTDAEGDNIYEVTVQARTATNDLVDTQHISVNVRNVHEVGQPDPCTGCDAEDAKEVAIADVDYDIAWNGSYFRMTLSVDVETEEGEECPVLIYVDAVLEEEDVSYLRDAGHGSPIVALNNPVFHSAHSYSWPGNGYTIPGDHPNTHTIAIPNRAGYDGFLNFSNTTYEGLESPLCEGPYKLTVKIRDCNNKVGEKIIHGVTLPSPAGGCVGEGCSASWLGDLNVSQGSSKLQYSVCNPTGKAVAVPVDFGAETTAHRQYWFKYQSTYGIASYHYFLFHTVGPAGNVFQVTWQPCPVFASQWNPFQIQFVPLPPPSFTGEDANGYYTGRLVDHGLGVSTGSKLASYVPYLFRVEVWNKDGSDDDQHAWGFFHNKKSSSVTDGGVVHHHWDFAPAEHGGDETAGAELICSGPNDQGILRNCPSPRTGEANAGTYFPVTGAESFWH